MTGAGRVVRRLLSPGQAGDAPRVPALLDGLRPGQAVADAAYDSDAIRDRVRRAKARACIRPNPTRKRRKRYGRRRYRHRNVVERFVGRVKRCRRVATRYEKKAANFAGFVWLATFVTAEE